MIFPQKRITKALIDCGCAGWSAPVLSANPGRQDFSRQGPIMNLLFSYFETCTIFGYIYYAFMIILDTLVTNPAPSSHELNTVLLRKGPVSYE